MSNDHEDQEEYTGQRRAYDLARINAADEASKMMCMPSQPRGH
jgi:hypothetical protein